MTFEYSAAPASADEFPTPAREPATAHEPSVECPSCPVAARQSAATDSPAACVGCGGVWGDGPVSAAPSASSGQVRFAVVVAAMGPLASTALAGRTPSLPDTSRAPGTSRVPGKRTRTHQRTYPRDPDARLRAVVDELLRWHLARSQWAAIGYGSFAPIRQGSPTAGAMRVLSTGIIGDGCSGTKGTWRGSAQEPGEVHVVALDVRTATRYGQLGELREVADAVIADAEGDRLVDVELYRERGEPKLVALSLAQRIGWAMAEEKQRARWRVKFAKRDSYPALAGMSLAGEERLKALVERWGELLEQERLDAIAAECRAEGITGPEVGFDTLHRKLEAGLRVASERRAKTAEVAK